MFLNFFALPNLSSEEGVTEVQPWDYLPTPTALAKIRALKKEERRKWTLNPATKWQCYSALCGVNPGRRIGKNNAARLIHGVVVDYDTKCSLESVLEFINSTLPDEKQPNFLEHSLGGKNRLVWVFGSPLMVTSSKHAEQLFEQFAEALKLESLLPGYDPSSMKSSQFWTNGGEWMGLKETPLSGDLVFGIAADVGRRVEVTGIEEVPFDIIKAEVFERFPGRWTGDFAIDSLGVRFWDAKADCTTGAQVKPDGMLCFTGNVPFVSWGEIFGFEWVAAQRARNLGKASEGVYFDGRQYWLKTNGVWLPQARQDVSLHLNHAGLSSKLNRGATISDSDSVLWFIQNNNRVEGAAPMINQPPGLITVCGRQMLNTVNLSFPDMVPGPVVLERDCPFIWNFLINFFAEPQLLPLEHFLAHWARFHRAMRDHQRLMGQAVFICGPRHNGKTLLLHRLIKPTCGDRSANPYDWLVGNTSFNDEVFACPMLEINDEESPKSEAEKATYNSRAKGIVANPTHSYHPKFCSRVSIEWCGRLYVTLNDDPASTGMLCEVNSSTVDKLMFFRSQPYAGVWPTVAEIEATINRELPFWCRWLYDYTPDSRVVEQSRMGIKSYFDPKILQFSQEQARSYNLREIMETWIKTHESWSQGKDVWTGTPTDLMSELTTCPTTAGVVKDWSVEKAAKALTALARTGSSRVKIDDTIPGSRTFVINR